MLKKMRQNIRIKYTQKWCSANNDISKVAKRNLCVYLRENTHENQHYHFLIAENYWDLNEVIYRVRARERETKGINSWQYTFIEIRYSYL